MYLRHYIDNDQRNSRVAFVEFGWPSVCGNIWSSAVLVRGIIEGYLWTVPFLFLFARRISSFPEVFLNPGLMLKHSILKNCCFCVQELEGGTKSFKDVCAPCRPVLATVLLALNCLLLKFNTLVNSSSKL